MTEESDVPAPVGFEDNASLSQTEISFLDTECFEQRTIPCNYDPRDIEGRITKGYKMFIKKGTNRITLFRFLMGKLIYSLEGLSLEEYILFYHLYFDLLDLIDRDPNFRLKYEVDFVKLRHLINPLSRVKVFPVQLKEKSKEVVKKMFSSLVPSSRAYFGLTGQRDLRQSFRLVLNDTIVPKRIPPKRFIGVGYKDKGSRRDPAYDGTPSWQEVASYFANLERESEELDSSSSYFPDGEYE